ncbi:O-antigen ligase family protein [Stappia sp. F7233]|uniref:O-antigen ligase family protein n=2 Tax=Stappia albiluteola TaxID=2758565 RepID=A0A839AB06_9HYPH|nr:O-antigen ligase family protein [Stappia albiluteola]
MIALVSVWALFGLTLKPAFGPMIVCYLIYMAGGLVAVSVASDLGAAAMYMAVSGFLVVTAIFYAAVIAETPQRLTVIRSAYVASATIVALIGILGYFGAIPGASLFTLYDRAKGTFQDPNVFGPFLVLPTAFLFHDILNRPLSKNFLSIALALLLCFGIFLSFSRAAWGLLAFTGLGLYAIAFINGRSPARRARLVGLALLGVLLLALMFAAALSSETIAAMFEERAKLVQTYDGSRLGRFARHAIGFQMVMERPLGLGPLEFRNYFPEDEHNSYLKAFTSYGWLGGVAYFVLVCWTLKRLFPLVFQPRPWAAFSQCVFIVLFGHAIIAVVIDTDHWRHMYLLIGLAWGLIAAEQRERTRLNRGKFVHRVTSRLAKPARSG